MRVFLFLFLLSLGSLAQTVGSDDWIYDQVRIKLTNDRDVKGGTLDVKVNGGVVELRGVVPTDKLKGKAERLARKVKGVKSVNNQLKVGPPEARKQT